MTGDPSTLRIGVIMAGGSGERFWPLSRRQRPKQLLPLVSRDRSLLAEAVDRLLPLVPAERIIIATAEHLREASLDANLPVPPENVIAEPCKRNTTGCLAFVTAHCLHRYAGEDLSVAVLGADDRIADGEAFQRVAETALAWVEREPALATIGLTPTRPETGYGYIETGQPLSDGVYRVTRFREKPSLEQAQEFIDTGRFLWNSGMFFWRQSTFLAELEAAQPSVAALTQELTAAIAQSDVDELATVFHRFPDISIDRALMERASNIIVVRGDIGWDNISAWDSLARIHEPDADGNVRFGEAMLVDVGDSLIYNDCEPDAMAVGVVGVHDVVVVVSADGVLVCDKNRCQDVRLVVDELRRRGADQV